MLWSLMMCNNKKKTPQTCLPTFIVIDVIDVHLPQIEKNFTNGITSQKSMF